MPDVSERNLLIQPPFKGICIIGDFLLLAALFLIPIAIDTSMFRPYSDLKYLILGMLTTLLLPVLAFHILLVPAGRSGVVSRAFPVTLALWVCVYVLSALLSTRRDYALAQCAFPFACAIFAVWAFLRAPHSRLLEFAAYVLAIAALFNAIYGFAQYMGHDFLVLEEPGKPVGFIGNANMTAQFLILILPLFFAFAWNGPARLLFLIAIPCVLLHLLLLKSRGGIVGGAGGIILFAVGIRYIISRRPDGSKVRLIRFNRATILVLVIGTIVTAGTFLILDRGELITEVGSVFSASPESNRYRLLAWEASLRLAAAHPVLGVGPGHFRFFHPIYASAEFWRLNDTYGRIRLLQAHNDYINILCELGLAGLVLFLGIIVLLARGAGRLLRSASCDEVLRIQALGLTAGLFSALLQSLFDFGLYNPVSGLIFWVTAGFLAGMCTTETGPAGARSKWVRFAVGGFLLIVSIAAFVIIPVRIIAAWQGEKMMRWAELNFSAGRYERASQWASAALKCQPGDIDAVAILADSLRNIKGREAEAAAAYLQWSTLEPNYIPIFNRLGDCYFSLGKNEKAREAFMKALSINPYSAPDLLNLGNLALVDKKYGEAVEYYEKAGVTASELVRQNEAQFGIALFRLGRYKEAIPHLEAGIAFIPEKSAFLLELLGDAHVAIGEHAAAAEVYRRALLLGAKANVREKLKKESIQTGQ